jgi:hypothetical protein
MLVIWYMCRVGPNRMTVYTPYSPYAVYPVPYLQVVHPRLGFNSLQKRLVLFLVHIFFLVAFCTEHSLYFLLTYMHVFALNT